jgi:hypothetical protein
VRDDEPYVQDRTPCVEIENDEAWYYQVPLFLGGENVINRRELFWEEEQGLRKMTKIEWRWGNLKATPPPYLWDGVELQRELAILDFYMKWSIEEFIEGEGILRPRQIVLLRECTRGLATLLRQLYRASPYSSYVSYFEQLLALAREVLRRVKVKEAYHIVRHDTDREMEDFYSSPFVSPFESEKAVSIEQPVFSTEPLGDSNESTIRSIYDK